MRLKTVRPGERIELSRLLDPAAGRGARQEGGAPVSGRAGGPGGDFEEVFERCSTATAPWRIVPADKKWYRNLLIAEAIVETLGGMELRYPPAAEGIDEVEIA